MPKSTLTEKRYAVCIGINEYQHSAGLSSLRYAEGDAQAMDSLLGQSGKELAEQGTTASEALIASSQSRKESGWHYF